MEGSARISPQFPIEGVKMLGIFKKRNKNRRTTFVKKGRFAHLRAMTSSELDEYMFSDEITPEEYAFGIKLQKEYARA